MGKIYIYSAAMFPEICVQIRKDIRKKWVFLLRHNVKC